MLLPSFKQADLREQKCDSTDIHKEKLKVLLPLLTDEVLRTTKHYDTCVCCTVFCRREL